MQPAMQIALDHDHLESALALRSGLLCLSHGPLSCQQVVILIRGHCTSLRGGSLAVRASVDKDPNDVSFYAPTRRRAVRLAHVSEVATAFAAERTERGDENG